MLLQELTTDQLNQVRQAMTRQIEEGMGQDGKALACLPAYLGPPRKNLAGKAIVVDAGGTNVRAALMELQEHPKVLAGPFKGVLPDGRHAPIEAAEFFGYQAELVSQLNAPPDCPVGYCFSYPARVEPQGDARLLYWTKGIRVNGVVGEFVGEALRSAVGSSSPVKVLNDTVACLLGGAYLGGQRYPNYIGLIVGTGTNMATFMPAGRVPKLHPSWQGAVALNLESGNFHPPHLHSVDDSLDASSDNRGRQRYEKAVSGYYLPYLLQLLCPELSLPDDPSSEIVVEWAQKGQSEGPSAAARWLLNRSADLVAAGLASVADQLEPGPVAVLAEGGLFWNAPGYSQRVEATLRSLKNDHPFTILRLDDVNLVGAAVAALS